MRSESRNSQKASAIMAQSVGSYTNPLKKFKLVFLGEQSGTCILTTSTPLIH